MGQEVSYQNAAGYLADQTPEALVVIAPAARPVVSARIADAAGIDKASCLARPAPAHLVDVAPVYPAAGLPDIFSGQCPHVNPDRRAPCSTLEGSGAGSRWSASQRGNADGAGNPCEKKTVSDHVHVVTIGCFQGSWHFLEAIIRRAILHRCRQACP